jgi:hypothetical protein
MFVFNHYYKYGKGGVSYISHVGVTKCATLYGEAELVPPLPECGSSLLRPKLLVEPAEIIGACAVVDRQETTENAH